MDNDQNLHDMPAGDRHQRPSISHNITGAEHDLHRAPNVVEHPHPTLETAHTVGQTGNNAVMPPVAPAILGQRYNVPPFGAHDDDDMADDLPDLQSVSDSSDDDDEADDIDVEMNIAMASDSDVEMPPLETVPATATSTSARRPRVDDDDDIRTPAGTSTAPPNPNPNTGAASAARPSGRPVRPLPRNGPPPLRPRQFNPLFATMGGGMGTQVPFDFPSMFGHLFGQAGQPTTPGAQPRARSEDHPPQTAAEDDATRSSNTSPAPDATAHTPNQPGATPHTTGSGRPGPHPTRAGRGPSGFAFFTTDPTQFNAEQGNGAPPREPDGRQRQGDAGMGGMPVGFENFLRNILSGDLGPFFTGHMENEREDPERAKRLIAGLEVVPHALVRRLERVGGVADTHQNDDLSGGEAGCAICWDKLLDSDGFGSNPTEKTEENTGNVDATSAQPAEEASDPPLVNLPTPSADASDPPLADLPIDEAPVSSEEPKIVTLPCAHIFHASCLKPWFSRPGQTTCPTCRFNIDPENLTYRYRPPRTASRPNPRRRSRTATEAGAEDVDHVAQAAPAERPTRQEEMATDGPNPITPLAGAQPHTATGATAENGDGRRRPGHRPRSGEWRAFNFGYDRTPTDMGADGQFFSINFDVIFNPVTGNAQGQTNTQGQTNAQPPAQGQGGNETGANANAHAPTHTFHMGNFSNFMEMFGEPRTQATAGGAVPGDGPGTAPRAPPTQPRPKKKWTLPPPPGLTLRQRVERKEREAGLRCSDVSCGYGPTDEDPIPEAPPSSKQLSIRPISGSSTIITRVCEHTFHPACLVRAERVAGWGAREGSNEPVQVACPVCRAVGVVDHYDWNEGVQTSS